MKTCPKCQFVQPPDRFCAQCGVDMDSYRPPPPPLAKRIFNNIYFQLAIVSLVVFVSINSLIDQKSDLAEPIEEIEEVETITAEEQDERIIEPPAPAEKPTFQNARSNSQLRDQNSEIRKFREEVKDKLKPLPQLTLRVFSGEVAQETLQIIFEGSSQKEPMANAVSGVFPRLSENFNEPQSFPDFDSIALKEPPPAIGLRKSVPIQNFFPEIEGSGVRRGLEIEASLTQQREDSAKMLVRVRVDLTPLEEEAEVDESLQNTFNAVFNLKPGDIAFISSFLPKSPPALSEADSFFLSGPFAIFTSPDFTENNTDSILVFRVEGWPETSP